MNLTAVGSLVEPATSEFWQSIGVFPDAITTPGKLEESRRRVRKTLLELGPGNLRLLYERAKLTRDPKAGVGQLVEGLLAADPTDTLLNLREFLHRRVAPVDEMYAVRLTAADRAATDGDLSAHGPPGEQLKVFTKLVLLYRRHRDALRDVYYLKLVRSRPTCFELVSEGRLPANAADRIHDAGGRLEHDIQDIKPAVPVRYQGCHTLPNGLVVVSVLRRYSPTVRADFRPEQPVTTHHGFGHVVFTLHPARTRIDIRSRSGRVADAVEAVLASVLGVKLKRLKRSVVTDYDAAQVTARLLGGYPSEAAVRLVGVRFRRSGLPNQSPLAVEVGPHQANVRDDLGVLREAGLVQLRNLTDIEHLTLGYEGLTGKVVPEAIRGGLVRLAFDNTDWDDDHETGFREEFEKSFALPLDAPIDPSRLAMGQEGIIAHLLTVHTADQVQPFQKKVFDGLVGRGILARQTESVAVCRKPGCDPKPAADAGAQECPRCGGRLARENVTRVTRVSGAIRDVLGDALAAPGCSLSNKEAKFERTGYYPLQVIDPSGQPATVAVLVRDSLSDSTRVRLERSGRALLVARARTADKPIFLDDAGVGQVSLAYLLAADGVPAEKEEARRRCRELLLALQRDHIRRVHQSATRSHAALVEGAQTRTDQEFETDVFNVLRAIFPDAIKLGRHGKPEPDGLCGLPVFEDGSLREGLLWGWTYDAKLAESGGPYPLEIGEYRKMKDYIDKFRRANSLYAKSKRVKAHVLISNNIAPGRMKVAADYLAGPDGLRAENKEVRLVYMELAFLLRLFERVRERDDDIRRRGPFLAEAMAERLGTAGPDGYVHLTGPDADSLADAVLSRDPVQPSVDLHKLLGELSGS